MPRAPWLLERPARVRAPRPPRHQDQGLPDGAAALCISRREPGQARVPQDSSCTHVTDMPRGPEPRGQKRVVPHPSYQCHAGSQATGRPQNRSLLCVVWACRAPHAQGDRSSSVAAALPPGNQTRQYNNRRPPASSTLPASPLTGPLAEPPCKSTMQRDAGAAPPRPARPRSPARQPPAGRPCRPRTGERAPGRAQRQRCCRHAAAAASPAPAPAPARSGSSSRENAYCAGGTAYSCPGAHARLSRARLRAPLAPGSAEPGHACINRRPASCQLI